MREFWGRTLQRSSNCILLLNSFEAVSGFLPCTILLKALLPKSKDLNDLAVCLIHLGQNFFSEIYNFH